MSVVFLEKIQQSASDLSTIRFRDLKHQAQIQSVVEGKYLFNGRLIRYFLWRVKGKKGNLFYGLEEEVLFLESFFADVNCLCGKGAKALRVRRVLSNVRARLSLKRWKWETRSLDMG